MCVEDLEYRMAMASLFSSLSFDKEDHINVVFEDIVYQLVLLRNSRF